VALAGLQRPGSPLRAALLSLGSALTLLVACTLVVAVLLRTVNETVPQQAPALVFHDVQSDQLRDAAQVLASAPSLQRVQTAPLVLGRLAAVNGEALRDSATARAARGARRAQAQPPRRQHRRCHRRARRLVAGRAPRRAAVAMEDREADQLGPAGRRPAALRDPGPAGGGRTGGDLQPAALPGAAVAGGIFSDGVLDPFVTRHVGAAYLSATTTPSPRRTGWPPPRPTSPACARPTMLDATRGLMARASGGLAVIAGACLAASLLVLASVVAASRSRQLYEASVMHALGARMSSLRRVLRWEYTLLALVTAASRC
jgi:putative ABC transport system permease protein